MTRRAPLRPAAGRPEGPRRLTAGTSTQSSMSVQPSWALGWGSPLDSLRLSHADPRVGAAVGRAGLPVGGAR